MGDGQGVFTAGASVYAGDDPAAMVSGNFGDGHIDLIVADQGNPYTGVAAGLTVFRCDSAGQLQLSSTYAVGLDPTALVAADFTNDGVLDLAVADGISDDVTVLLNDGQGHFTSLPADPVGTLPSALAAFDLGNGQVDLIAANANSHDISVLIGNGDGTFQPQARYGAGTFPEGLVVADFNGDNRPDLAVGNRASQDISILLGRGDGTFQDQLSNPVGNGPVAEVTADLNHDGHLDIITTNDASDDISVLLGNGDGTFQPAREFWAGVDPVALAVGDFNGDGRLDVAVVDGGNSDGSDAGVLVLLGNGDGTFNETDPNSYPTGSNPSSIAVGDFTGNGVLDLAVANLESDDVSILFGDGNGGFTSAAAPIELGDSASEPIAIVAGDFTGNGEVDLAVAEQATNNVSILEGNGHGSFQPLDPIPLGDDPLSFAIGLVAGNFDNNNIMDLAVVSLSLDEASTVSILLAQGQGRFSLQSPITPVAGFAPTSIAAGAFFDDGTTDLAVIDQSAGQIELLRGDGSGGFQLGSTISLPSTGTPDAITAADFTGDGLLDLAVALQSPNSVTVELNLGNGNLHPPIPWGSCKETRPSWPTLPATASATWSSTTGPATSSFGRASPTSRGNSRRRSRSIKVRHCHAASRRLSPARGPCWPA